MRICYALENFESLYWLAVQCFECYRIKYCVFKHYQAINIEKIFDFIKAPIFMLKQASLTVRAVQFFIESCASFRLVFVVVDRRCLAHQLMFSMSKLAFVSVSAESDLNPVLAHLCLVFCFINFLHLRRLH